MSNLVLSLELLSGVLPAGVQEILTQLAAMAEGYGKRLQWIETASRRLPQFRRALATASRTSGGRECKRLSPGKV